MGLKIKQIPFLTNEHGFKDENTIFSIASVTFDYQQMTATIEWEITPSSWVEGKPKLKRYQTLQVNPQDETVIGLLLAVSDKLHEINDETPFIPTFEGISSFADLEGQTIDVGLPSFG